MRNLERDIELIESFGTRQLARICEVSASTVSCWKRTGIPKAWLKYFRVAYPHLEVWKKYAR